MVTVGLFVPLQSMPGKEAEVESFLESGRALAEECDVIAAKLPG
jgi:hypothetical protein